MERKFYLFLLLSFFSALGIRAQMVVDNDTLVGNEWITFGQKYYKFTVDADGICRIPYSTLQDAGLASTPGSEFRIYSYGQQIPLYVSTSAIFGPNDFIEFLGKRNRGELDRFLFRSPDKDMLHPDHSMYTDKRPYYLTVSGTDTPLRVETLPNDIGNAPPVQPYYLHKEVLDYSSVHNDPYSPISGGGAISYSSYLHGEGFSKASETNSFTNVNTSDRIPGTQATLHIRMTSANSGDHAFLVYWNGELLDTLFASGLKIIDTYFDLPVEKILDANQLNINNSNSISRHSLVTIELAYARIADWSGVSMASMETKNLAGDLHYVLENFAHQNLPPIVYSRDGTKRMLTVLNGENHVEFNWPASASTDALYIQDQGTSIRFISTMNEMSFQDFTADDTEYIVITHPELMAPGTESEYIQYRLSPEGGAYKAYAYSILDLYEHFGYGVERHPMAIRNFVEFIHRHWSSARMIFIVGRGLEYNRSRYENGTWENQFFVPTFGRPGADNLLAATPWSLVPRYPIGRLAVTHPSGITLYLNKVKEHDQAVVEDKTVEEKAWMKNVIHIGGGKESNEQANFADILNSLAHDISSSDFGASVSFFQKTTTDVIGESTSKQIEKLLKEGSSIINYLGHSSTSTFEFTINDPSEWNNKGRYPVFSAMGCSAGQIHGPTLSLSDRFVLIADEGAIAFISGSGSQFPNALVSWARPWYNYFGTIQYGTTLGESVLFGLKALDNFIDMNNTGSNPYRYLIEQQTLQGDPALKINPQPGPDYSINRNSVLVSPGILNTMLDSFDISFAILNTGRNLRQTAGYTMSLVASSGKEFLLLEDTVRCERFSTTVSSRFARPEGIEPGSFRLYITVDPGGVIAEQPLPDAENNNALKDNLGVEGIQVVILDNQVNAVYPPDFAIINEAPALVGSGSDAFLSNQTYVAEIDTTPLFNSPAKHRTRLENIQGTMKWIPDLNYTDHQEYYWRISLDSVSPDQSYLWSRRSFIYQAGSPEGWNQSHFYQQAGNHFEQMLADSSRLAFAFESAVTNFRILNRYQKPSSGGIPFGYIDNVFLTEFFSKFTNNDVHVFVVAVNPLTGAYMLNPNPGLYGSFNNLSYDIHCFPFRTDLAEGRQALVEFVENIIPQDYYVFIYTYQRDGRADYFPELWAEDEITFGRSIFSVVENEYPESAIRTLAVTGSKPYIVQFQKGKGGVEEVIAKDTSEAISLSFDIKGSLGKGRMISPLIGPASSWYAIEQMITPETSDTSGVNTISAIALGPDLSDTLIITGKLSEQDTLINGIDADQFPFIQLSFFCQDSADFRPDELNHWRVLFDGFTEFVLRPDLGFEFNADTLNRGETLRLGTYVENLSQYHADSLPVSLRLIGEDNTTEILWKTLYNIPGHGSAWIEFEKETSSLTGDYQLLMEINPERSIPELNYNNNIGIKTLHISSDQVNPLLDVRFDGYHIQNGDLVSAKPSIRIELADENNQLRLDDTSAFEIYLQFPSDLNPQRVYFSQSWVMFTPATESGANMAMVDLTPDLFEKGTYTLEVNAVDKSGNPSGANNYKVSFEVTHEPAISYIYNFPNPFRTSTRFIYTLTGDGAPADYWIEIVSVSGIKVREITKTELGPWAVGHHMTEYAWDGTDQNGAMLSPGLYLYRLVAQDDNGNSFPVFNPYGYPSLVNQEWGKLVIIR